MPFTLAHPAAALPLKRFLGRRGVPAALVIGSLVPDLPYFLPLSEHASRTFAHRPLALLWFCLPAGCALWLLFEAVLRQPLTALLPTALRRRLPEAGGFAWREVAWPSVALSALLGAATHLAWDSLTKEQSPVLEVVPALRVGLFPVGGDTLHLYRLLQHASTVAGIALLALWTARWWRRTPARPALPVERGSSAPWAALALVLGAAAWAALEAAPVVAAPDHVVPVRFAVRIMAVESLRALGVAVLAWATLWHLRRRLASTAPG